MSGAFRVPPLSGEPCACDDCRVAGVTSLAVVRTPNGELHGVALARWYAARERAVQAIQRLRFTGGAPRRMPDAIVQTDPDGREL